MYASSQPVCVSPKAAPDQSVVQQRADQVPLRRQWFEIFMFPVCIKGIFLTNLQICKISSCVLLRSLATRLKLCLNTHRQTQIHEYTHAHTHVCVHTYAHTFLFHHHHHHHGGPSVSRMTLSVPLICGYGSGSAGRSWTCRAVRSLGTGSLHLSLG